MQTTDNPRDRTKYEAMFDIDYAIEVRARSRNYYTLLRFVFGFAFIASGSAALAAIQLGGGMQALLSATVTIMGILSVMIDPGAMAARHEAIRYQWALLRKDAQQLELSALDERINAMYTESLPTLRCLQRPSYNAVSQRLGHEELAYKLTRFQRFMGWLT